VDAVSADARQALTELRDRFDDFAVKPAGQRGFAAVLVIVGSLLMFAEGLLEG